MKFVSASFLLIALISLFYMNIGQLGTIYINIGEARSEASEKVRAGSHSQTLQFSLKDISEGKAAFINSGEIRYEGRLYDIASTQKAGGTYLLKVVSDDKESGLISQMKEAIDGLFADHKSASSKHHPVRSLTLIQDFIPVDRYSGHFSTCSSGTFVFSVFRSPRSPFLSMINRPPEVR